MGSNAGPAIVRKLSDFEKVIRKFTANADDVIVQLEAVEQLDSAELMKSVVKQIEPVIRAELKKSYQRSGVGRATGTLERVVVTEAIIGPTRQGFYVKYAPGVAYKSGKGSPYGAAGAFRYGAVHQPLTKAKGSLYKDLSTGLMVPRKKAAGDLGWRAKQTLKKSVLKKKNPNVNIFYGSKNVGNGVYVTRPKPGFFELDTAQQQRVVRAAIPVMIGELKQRGIRAVGA
jgi:hypothetical protein